MGPINMTSTVGSMWCKVYNKFGKQKIKKKKLKINYGTILKKKL